MLCNWCNKEIEGKEFDDSGKVYYECNCCKSPEADNNAPTVISLFGSIFYYDIYHVINGITYNVEGMDNNTRFIALGDMMTVFHQAPFYHLTSNEPIKEAVDLLTKIVKLKAFT